MEKQKDDKKGFSTCLEDSPCAEMMKKMMGQQGIGSICEKMMKSMTMSCCSIKEEPKEAKEEEGHGREK